jgi:hypothetical protein
MFSYLEVVDDSVVVPEFATQDIQQVFSHLLQFFSQCLKGENFVTDLL